MAILLPDAGAVKASCRRPTTSPRGSLNSSPSRAAPRAAAPTTSESVKYTMFLPFEFDASKNEVSIETA
jgi:hypothetical protein